MTTRITGWLIAIIYFIQSLLLVRLPRTDKALPMREELRGWHYLIGSILLLLVAYHLYLWWKDDRRSPAPAGMRPGYWNWTRALTLTTFVALLITPFFGLFNAWSDGLTVHLGPFVTIPALIGESTRVWMFSFYFHSAISFMIMLLFLAALLTAAYGWLRYGKGLFTSFPNGFGAMALSAVVVTQYALATFKSPEPGPMAVARFIGVIAVVAAIGWFIHPNRTAKARPEEAPRKALWASAVAALVIVGVGAYGPHAMFRVTPWPMGEVIAGPEGVTSHSAPVTRVKAWNETAYEREVAAQTYKWCGFCHSYNKNDKVKAGPPLYAIFGQPAASVPNFHYSPALAAKRDKGLVWTEDQLDAFLANPDKFAPGTSMIISSGPVTDPKVRRAVINMLKRDTMKGAIDTVPAPAGQ